MSNMKPTSPQRGRKPQSGPRIPIYDLETGVDLARILHTDLGGSATAPALAAKLGYSGVQNGAFINRLASARMFGLLEGTRDDLTLSERARALVMPEDGDMEARARVDAFEAVPLYSQFYDYFQGRPLPGREGLVNALQGRFGVPKERTGFALDRLLRSAEQAGYFRTAADRLIRPRVVPSSQTASTPSSDAKPEGEKTPLRLQLRSMKGSDHLLIQGAFGELPDIGTSWDEAGLQQWLDLVETAARVIYRLPNKAEDQHRHRHRRDAAGPAKEET